MEEQADATPQTRNSALRMVSTAAGTITVASLFVHHLLESLHLGEMVNEGIEATAMAVLSCSALWLAVIRPLRREADHERSISHDREEALRSDSRRQDFEGALHRAVEMASTEEAVYAVTAKAIAKGAGTVHAELLLADSSEAHLKRAVAVGGEERHARCGVVAPRDCPAIRRAQTLTFSSSEHLDACPHLESRPTGPCAAACVPVSVGGRSIGVLHAASDIATPATADHIAALEAIATQSGSRIGLLRVMEATHLQAATDPLTGLLNRRSFENRAHDFIRKGIPFALAMGDLDHFKRLNDTHGHDAGDRALRVFAQTMRAALRGDDLLCRYGGEEFVALFPMRSSDEAAAALERVREELLITVAGGAVPPFTVSFGVAHSEQEADLEELCRLADAALFRAKREGRNRVVIDTLIDAPVDAPADAPTTA